MEEVWRDVVGFEDRYSISSLGNLKAKSYRKERGMHSAQMKEKILSKHIGKHGYMIFKLCKNKKTKTYKIHQLVAMAFLNHMPCGYELVVDHINNNRLDNRVENLQLVTSRANCSKDKKNKTSKYTGVSWDKSRDKWTSRLKVGNKYLYLGRFNNEYEAHLAYQNKLKEILCEN